MKLTNRLYIEWDVERLLRERRCREVQLGVKTLRHHLKCVGVTIDCWGVPYYFDKSDFSLQTFQDYCFYWDARPDIEMRTQRPSPTRIPTNHAEQMLGKRAKGPLGELQTAAQNSAATQSLRMLQRRANQSAISAARETSDNSGVPARLRAGIEAMSGVSLKGVRVHRNSPKPAQLRAHAYAQGRDIHLAPGQDQHLPHEAWHVVQQATGRVRATGAEGDQPINDDPGLEREADQMGARALSLSPPPAQALPLQRVPDNKTPVQRVYANQSAMDQARIDQEADTKYAEKALTFELGMAQRIMRDPGVNASVDVMLARLKTIVDQWALHTGQTQAAVYEHEFGWPPGDEFYGAFDMTAENITAVFTNRNQPMRSKLKLIYNAVRNNALAKWLKVAGLELDRAARRKRSKSVKVRSQAVSVDRSGPTEKRVSRSKDETVKPGFAAASGIAGFHDDAEQQELIDHAKTEQRRSGGGTFSRGRRNLFDHAHTSNALDWKPATKKADSERLVGASHRIPDRQQRHLDAGMVPDLTDEEINFMMARRGMTIMTPVSRNMFRQAGENNQGAPLTWTQGRNYYEVDLGSDSAKEAAKIKARMESGISGSTDLMMHAGEHLGLKGAVQKMPLRMALAGWMIAARDHSFYEVFKAAEAYGVPFNVDENHPGSEYENLPNLIPMRRADFADILPAEGNVAQVFPSLYQTQAWKDYRAAQIATPGTNEADVKTDLINAGVQALSLSVMNERDLAAMEQLKTAVQGADLANDPPRDARLRAMQQMRDEPAFIYLGNMFGRDKANRTLIELMAQTYQIAGLTEVDPEDYRPVDQARGAEEQLWKANLRKVGIPDVIVDHVGYHDLSGLEHLRDVISKRPEPAEGEILPAQYNQYINYLTAPAPVGLINLDRERCEMVVGAMIRYYLPGAPEPEGLEAQTDRINRIREIEQVINMERTSGVWYSWGLGTRHVQYINAPSLREFTHFVTSPQGPGLYVSNNATSTSAYGANAGDRVLIVKMSNVPTVNQRNPEQMSRLNRLLGFGVAPLQKSGLFEANIRAEFLMRYGNGSVGRLTTNKGVTMTLNLNAAPVDHLRERFPDLTRWQGRSRDNFIAQAAESNLSLDGWG